jgi:60S ribosomal protein uL30
MSDAAKAKKDPSQGKTEEKKAQPAKQPKQKKEKKPKSDKAPSKLSVKRKRKAERLKKKLKISVPVPEGLKKSWEREARVKARRKKLREETIKKLPEKRAKQADRIEKFEEEYRKLKETQQQDILKSRLEGNFFKTADPKVMVVVRIRGINRISPKVKKVLHLFRLLQLHNAVFIKVNKATTNMLKLIQPYVAYGYPNVSTIRSLIYKRGFAKIRHRPGSISRVPIMSNAFIQQHLGRYGIETVEDMVHEIFTVGPNFRSVTNFLWPFKLNCPRGGYRGRKRRHYNEGGSYGNWENHINNMVIRML